MSYRAIDIKEVTPGYWTYRMMYETRTGQLQFVFMGTRRETSGKLAVDFIRRLEKRMDARLDTGTLPKVGRDAYNDMNRKRKQPCLV